MFYVWKVCIEMLLPKQDEKCDYIGRIFLDRQTCLSPCHNNRHYFVIE